jgi:hypothetical protein
VAVGFDDFRARVEGGFMLTAPSGLAFRLTGNVDGVGSSTLSGYGGEAWINIPLH